MDAAVIQQRLRSFIDRHARFRNVEIRPDAYNDVVGYARKAAYDLAALPPEKRDVQIEDAERGFATLIDTMIEVAPMTHGFVPGQIGENSLRDALLRLCPLFPFC